SPQSATRSRENGEVRSIGLYGRISSEWLRTSFGPNRAPGRKLTPPSNGIPRMAASRPAISRVWGSRMNVEICAKRGDWNAFGGSNRPSVIGTCLRAHHLGGLLADHRQHPALGAHKLVGGR